jgi:D-inositol-3-phosphate glycosyltransferase
MFHIIFLSPHSDPQAEMGELDSGGQCIYEHQLALALSEQPEFRVTTFCRQTGKRPDESIVNNSYKIIRIHSGEQKPVRKEELEREMDEFVTKVSTYLTEYERSDTIILHGHYWDGGYAALGLKSRWKYKLPFVWTPHSLGSLKRRKFMGIEHELFYQFVPRQCWESYSMHIADRVVLSTQKEKQSVLDDYGIDEQKIVITPPGVDIQSLQKIDQQEAREKWRLPTDGKIILSIGRMVRNKAYHLGILAFEELLKKFHEPVYLAIFGGSQHSSVDEVSPRTATVDS